MSNCRSCQTEIVWAMSASTGKTMPVDAASDPLGNVVLEENQSGVVAHVLAGRRLASARQEGKELHVNHFATCPDRDRYR